MVVINGRPEGPYTIDAVKSLDIKPSTFLKSPGMDDYKEAHEFPELRELFGFQEEHPIPQYFASFDQRLLAMVIDYFMLTLVYVMAVLLSFLVVEDKSQRIFIAFAGLPVLPLLKLSYGSISEASVQQAGLGKRLLNIKVTDLKGRRISLAHSFKRNIAKVISAIPVFFGYLYSFLNRKQQCFHDLIAETYVVKDRLI